MTGAIPLTHAPVIRRSALEAQHLALDARWIADDVHWPAGYGAGNDTMEQSALARGAGLAEIGPIDELLLRGLGARSTVGRSLMGGATPTTGRAVAVEIRGELGEVWLLAADEVLILAPVGGTALAAVAIEVASDDISAIEMTGARTSLRLAGPTAPAILAELCPDDTTPTSLVQGSLIQAPLAGVRAFIARQDAGAQPGYTIMIARDEAAYVWDVLCHIGEAHGLVPVGPAALTPEGRP